MPYRITEDKGRLLEFLWFVGYCGEFPARLGSRVAGSEGWTRHVMYRAVREDLVRVHREMHDRRVIRSLRLTPQGLRYIGERDPASLSLFPRDRAGSAQSGYVADLHAHAAALVMSHNAGALFLPRDKPALRASGQARPSDAALFYTAGELREALREVLPACVTGPSRCLGILLLGKRCCFLYHTGHSRMHWSAEAEERMCGATEALLRRLGFPCEDFRRVLIGSNMNVAVQLAGRGNVRRSSRFFHVTGDCGGCHYIPDSSFGDTLLELILREEKRASLERRLLRGYGPAAEGFDAVTADGLHPVSLCCTFDLAAILRTELCPAGFPGGTVLMCFDCQQDALQAIAGPMAEIHGIPEEVLYEKEK